MNGKRQASSLQDTPSSGLKRRVGLSKRRKVEDTKNIIDIDTKSEVTTATAQKSDDDSKLVNPASTSRTGTSEPTINESTKTEKESINAGTVRTPGLRGSLANRLKQSMQSNNSSKSPAALRAQRRSLLIQQANAEADKILKTETETSFYGLTKSMGETVLKNKGITDLYDWQKECLNLDAVKQGRNLIYSLPTSGGKTLVAEILILEQLLIKKRDAILILPYVSIVQEKTKTLAGLAVELDFAVEEYAGSKGTYPPRKRLKRHSLYVCTIEKSNTLISVLIENDRMAEIGLVVVDELHMLGDGSRGAILEVALTKLRHCAPRTQIIGMSATLSNIGDLQKFLDAEHYTNDFRPVELKEYMKVEDGIYEIPRGNMAEDVQFNLARIVQFPYTDDMKRNDPDCVLGLVLEIIPTNSCLVFCPTKKNCENVVEMMCKMMSKDLHYVRTAEKKDLIKSLKDNESGTMCPVLKRTIPFGLAYHHSGLTMHEREAIEQAYSTGVLCCLACTSTLAAGVNLPAKRVILRSIKVAKQLLSRNQYLQMVGRAGRAGIDKTGESVMIVKPAEKHLVKDIVTGPCERCHSSLMENDAKSLQTLLLGMICLKVATTAKGCLDFLSKTLYAIQISLTNDNWSDDLTKITQDALQELLTSGLIRQTKVDILDAAESESENLTLEVTKLGLATSKSGIVPSLSKQVYDDLCHARVSLNVASYLHLLYLVTPYDLPEQCNPAWMCYLDNLTRLSVDDQNLASYIGVSENYISKKASGRGVSKLKESEFVVKRFYLALMLYQLWQEKSLWDVAAMFDVTRGFVQNLLTSAASFASAIYHYCQELEEFWAYKDLLSDFVKRLSFCSSADLIPLMEIPGVKQGRAKQLQRAGFTSLGLIASASVPQLLAKVEHLTKKTAKDIINAAKMLLAEKVEALRDEASELMEIVMPGVDPALNPDIYTEPAVNRDQKQIHHDDMKSETVSKIETESRTETENDQRKPEVQSLRKSVSRSEVATNQVIDQDKINHENENECEKSLYEKTMTDEEMAQFCNNFSEESLFSENSERSEVVINSTGSTSANSSQDLFEKTVTENANSNSHLFDDDDNDLFNSDILSGF